MQMPCMHAAMKSLQKEEVGDGELVMENCKGMCWGKKKRKNEVYV